MNVPFLKNWPLPDIHEVRGLVTRLTKAGWIAQEAFHDDPPHRFVIRWSEKGRTQMTLMRQAFKRYRPDLFDSSAKPGGFWARLRWEWAFYRLTRDLEQLGIRFSERRLLLAMALSCDEADDGRVPAEFFSDLADD